MHRLARLNAPGVLHHIMIRGIECRKIFRNNNDRDDFLERLSIILPEKILLVMPGLFLTTTPIFYSEAVKPGYQR